MRRFVAVIGTRNAGKSTVIKSLTGCPTNGFRDFVEDQLTGHSIYVSCGSPQENPRGLASLSDLRTVFRKVLSRDGCRGVVMAIQPSKPYARKLWMEEILTEANRSGFKVSAYVLDPGHGGLPGTAAQIAHRISPLGIVPIRIDGRRFAHINAHRINAETKIAA